MEAEPKPVGSRSEAPGAAGGHGPTDGGGSADRRVRYALPVKRSVTIAGHETSIALEPVFWNALDDAARARALPLNALIAIIDAERIRNPAPPNLASAVRQWLFANLSQTA